MIYVIDDDASIRKSTKRLMKSAGLSAQAFSSAEEFMQLCQPTAADCLLLDIQMPGMSGLELQQQLSSSGIQTPVIFISAYEDAQIREAIRGTSSAGYLRKPFDDQALLDIIHSATSPSHD